MNINSNPGNGVNTNKVLTFDLLVNKYSIFILAIIVVIILIFVSINDKTIINENNDYIFYLLLIILPLIVICIVWTPGLNTNNTSYIWKITFTILTLMIIIIIGIVVYLIYTFFSPFEITLLDIFLIFIVTTVIVTIVYVIYNIIYENGSDIKFLVDIVLKILKFINSIFVNIFNYFKNIVFNFNFKLNINTLFSFIITLILCLIIISYFFADKVLNYFTNNGINNYGFGDSIGTSQLLLKSPTTINTLTVLSLDNPPTLPNYTFSFWAYINNFSNSNYEIPIFQYGANSPLIVMNNNTINNMVFYPSQYFVDNNQPFSFSVNTQKWNYFVIQYLSNSVELYLNSTLIYSYHFDNTTTPVYTIGDNIIIGNNNINSIGVGAISNVNYYSNPLTLSQINKQYSILSLQEIPTSF